MHPLPPVAPVDSGHCLIDCGAVTLASRIDGDPDAPPILLIHGLAQTIYDWPPALIETLVGAGYCVIRFDNRDVGKSTRLSSSGAPPLATLSVAALTGIPLAARAPYTIDDMAADTIALMDAMGIDRAHVVGASMGGMIAQRAVLRAPNRFLSLSCIMSSSGARGLPGARADVRKMMNQAVAAPPSAAAMADEARPLRRVLAGELSREESDELCARIAASAQHSFPPDGGEARQFAAILADRERVKLLDRIRLPTLIIHGSDDPLLPIGHGRDIARRIRNSHLVAIAGMAHDIRLRDVESVAGALTAHMTANTHRDGAQRSARAAGTVHVDVLIVGAGLSGIAAAWHIGTAHPNKSLAILEARKDIGGTWDLFRYPGIRSDSDMFTLGYSFKPWRNPKAIADGPAILDYIRETARDAGIDRNIRFSHKVMSADWSNEAQRWTVEVDAGGERKYFTCDFLFACCGYYRYDQGYQPDFAGRADFKGAFVHPQFWPDQLDWSDKRVVVIGSGATAVTLVPSLAKRAAHVAMLQRSPTYIVSQPAADEGAARLRRFLPERLAYAISRWKHILQSILTYRFSRKRPALVKRHILDGVRKEVGGVADVDTHFTPRYEPWDQRICVVPDGDLFAAIRDGRAEMVTDNIDHLDAAGIRLQSGRHLPADIVVSATGLELVFLGQIAISIDGKPVDLTQSFSFRGMMYSGVPNLAAAIGYTNASWTLKCELTAVWVCRLLTHMDRKKMGACVPVPSHDIEPDEDFMNLASGYVLRAKGRFPQQAAHDPWRPSNAFLRDYFTFRYGSIADDALRFIPRHSHGDR